MKKLLSTFLLLNLFSCVNPSSETIQKGNFNVEFLFENDGCKVYRFKDGDKYVYYTDCKGQTQSMHGKYHIQDYNTTDK